MDNITEGFIGFFGCDPAAYSRARYVSQDAVDRTLAKLDASDEATPGKVCFLYGMGSLPRASYEGLESVEGISVIHCESILPVGLRFIPSYSGLVKVEDRSKLSVVLADLLPYAMVGVYIFDANLEERFIQSVQSAPDRSDQSFGVTADAGYLIYVLYADIDDSSTGIVEYLSYGSDGPWGAIFA